MKVIADMRKRNANAGSVVFWVKLRQRGYTFNNRSVPSAAQTGANGGQTAEPEIYHLTRTCNIRDKGSK